MSYQNVGSGSIDYYPCRYGHSKLMFRGPKKQLDHDYFAVLGGSETFGKYMEEPYPELLEALCGNTVVNLGCMYAGPQLFSTDTTVLEICRKSCATVIQLTGVQNMSNRFYSVHSRRNDRFVGSSQLLRSVYPNIDLSEVHFTGHLLSVLRRGSSARYEMIKRELREEWVTKMKSTLVRIGGRIILLWLSDHAPGSRCAFGSQRDEPMLLNRSMIEELTGDNVEYLEIVAAPDEVSAGHDRMLFAPWEEAAARQMLGPIVHQEAARQLHSCLFS